MRKSIKISDFYSNLLIGLYLLICAVFFYNIALPYLENGIVVGADSKTYIETAHYYENLSQFNITDLISLKYNFFGPVILLILTRYNHLAIFVLNSLILIVCCHALFKHVNINKVVFFILLFINPITLISLTTINKEIFGISGMVLLITYLSSGIKRFLVMAFILAILTRWQQAVFIPVLLIYLNFMKIDRRFAWQVPVGVLIGVSLLYPFISSYIDFTGDVSRGGVQAQFNQAGGLLPLLNSLQNNFMYFLVFIPKALINYVGNFARIVDLFDTRIDLYNRLLVVHQIIMLALVLFLIIKRRISSKSLEFHIIYMYSIIYCVALTVNYRYFYPLFALFIIMALSNKITKFEKR